jgi:hypothetical protein
LVIAVVIIATGCAARDPMALLCEAANRLSTAADAIQAASAAADADDDRAFGHYAGVADALIRSSVSRIEAVDEDYREISDTWIAMRSAADDLSEAHRLATTREPAVAVGAALRSARAKIKLMPEGLEVCTEPSIILPPES